LIPFTPPDVDITEILSYEGTDVSHEGFFQALKNTIIHPQSNNDCTQCQANEHSLLRFSPQEIIVRLVNTDIEVDGLPIALTQISISDELVPSIESVNMFLAMLKDTDSRRTFCLASNDFIHEIICDYAPEQFVSRCEDLKTREYLLLQRLSLTLHEWCCQVLGDADFIFYLRSKAVISWFHFMVTNSRSYHLPTLVRKLPLNIESELGEIYLEKAQTNIVKGHPELERYPEYKEAMSSWRVINRYIENSPITLPIWWLILRTHHQQISYFKDKKETGSRAFTCPFCNCFKRLSPGVKEAVHCGDPECETKYDTQTKFKKRPPRPPIPQGWIKAYKGKRRPCNGCENTRQVYVEELNQHLIESQQLCRDCLEEQTVAE
jgi:hypothetical protein